MAFPATTRARLCPRVSSRARMTAEELCYEPAGTWVRDALARYAPLWLRQLPGLVVPDQWPMLEHHARDAGPGRMRRELAQALEVITAERSLDHRLIHSGPSIRLPRPHIGLPQLPLQPLGLRRTP